LIISLAMATRLRYAIAVLVLGFSALTWWTFQEKHDSWTRQYPDPHQLIYRNVFIAQELSSALRYQFLIMFLGISAWIVLPPVSHADDATTAERHSNLG